MNNEDLTLLIWIFNGWNGCGYIIIDPNTDAGAYMISGGMNGGVIKIYFGALLMFAGLLTTLSAVLSPMGILLFIAGATLMIQGLIEYFSSLTDKEVKCFNCMLPVFISGLFEAILSLYGGLYIRELLLTIFDVVSTYEGVRTVFYCIEKLL